MCTAMLTADGTRRISRSGPASCSSPSTDRAHRGVRERPRLSNFRLLSSEKNNYNRDYHGETADGGQMPILNVFVKDKNSALVRHRASVCEDEPGQNARHVDSIWPLWTCSTSARGRGRDWYPRLDYRG